MEIEKLIRKLEPLIPKRAGEWRRLRDIVDAETRGLIDQQIRITAHRLLGEGTNKLLLSLPPPFKARPPKSISLGTILYETEKWPAGISEGELLQNLAIFGRSGAGKTNVAFHIMKQLAEKQIPFLFLDWKRTARHLLPHMKHKVTLYTAGRSLAPLRFNPFTVPPGLEPRVYANLVVDVLGDAYTLGDGARSLLQKALDSIYTRNKGPPTTQLLLEEIKGVPDRERVRGWKTTALRALESLQISGIGQTVEDDPKQIVRDIQRGFTILELEGLNQGAKRFLIPVLCLWLYYSLLPHEAREQLRLVLFIEEAHHILHRNPGRSRETVMEMLLRQCREIGIGTIVIDQHPSLISQAALGNTFTSICLNQKDPTDINKAAALSQLTEDEKPLLSRLPVGQGIVKLQDRWREPFLVQFPLVHVDKGFMTDERFKGAAGLEVGTFGLQQSWKGQIWRIRADSVG